MLFPTPELGEQPNPSMTAKSPSQSTWQEYFDSVASSWARNRPRRFKHHSAVSGNRKTQWTSDEDKVLEVAVAVHGTQNWPKVATDVPGRTGKQCRERWLTHMAPDINHDAWSAQEDALLVGKLMEFGRHWSRIRQFLPGRSISSVKNRWAYLCRRDVPNHWQEFQALANVFPRAEGGEGSAVDGEDAIDFAELFLPEASLQIPTFSLWPDSSWANGDILGQTDQSE
jgi:myb proto-oncogene protein